jgi:Tol biopolymer transport system component
LFVDLAGRPYDAELVRGLLVAVALAGCYQPVVPTGLRCSQSGECPEGQLCDQVRNLCGGSPIDATPSDVATDTPVDTPTDTPIDALVLPAWNAPLPITQLNTADVETDPAISGDGLELFFASNRPGGVGNLDLYRAARTNPVLAFDAPTLVAELSTTALESGPFLTSDNLTLYFHRGGQILRATRPSRTAPFGAPVVDVELSSGDYDVNPALSPDGLTASVTRQLTAANRDLFLYVRPAPSASWSTGQVMTALQTTVTDSGAEFTTDPLEVYFHSDRSGSTDIYRATRATAAGAFGSPVAVAELSSGVLDSDPTITADRRLVVFERQENLVYATR